MIDKNKKIKIVAVFAVLLISLICMLFINFNLLFAKTLSISSINKERQNLEDAKNKYNVEEQVTVTQKLDKIAAQKAFTSAKSEYGSISKDTIKIVQEATKEEKYLIEYLWVELGNYAENNHLRLIVLEPNTKSTFVVKTTKAKGIEIVLDVAKTETTTTAAATETDETKKEVIGETKISINTDASTIKILVAGTYQYIADFVFEVENDKDLRFKLDNISMTYAKNNYVIATFDVLDMSILMK